MFNMSGNAASKTEDSAKCSPRCDFVKSPWYGSLPADADAASKSLDILMSHGASPKSLLPFLDKSK